MDKYLDSTIKFGIRPSAAQLANSRSPMMFVLKSYRLKIRNLFPGIPIFSHHWFENPQLTQNSVFTLGAMIRTDNIRETLEMLFISLKN